MRQAIRYAIDVPSIIEAAFEGRCERATAIIPPGMPIGYWADAPLYERDIDAGESVLVAQASEPAVRARVSSSPRRPARRRSPRSCRRTSPRSASTSHSKQLDTLGVLRARRRRSFRAASSSTSASSQPGSVVVDRVVRLRPDRRLELDVLVRRGVRPAPLRGDQGERPRRSQRHVHRDAAALGRRRRIRSGLAWPTRWFAARQGIEPALRPDGRILPTGSRAV